MRYIGILGSEGKLKVNKHDSKRPHVGLYESSRHKIGTHRWGRLRVQTIANNCCFSPWLLVAWWKTSTIWQSDTAGNIQYHWTLLYGLPRCCLCKLDSKKYRYTPRPSWQGRGNKVGKTDLTVFYTQIVGLVVPACGHINLGVYVFCRVSLDRGCVLS